MGEGGVDLGVTRFDVFLVSLSPTIGVEIRKTRPCLVISPNEMNRHLHTVIVAPMTTRTRAYPTRVPCRFQGKSGQVVLDQMRTIDRSRLVKRIGALGRPTSQRVLEALADLFAP